MAKVNAYITTLTGNQTPNSTKLVDAPAKESFEDVLVLNQTALKAMAIDEMVAQSPTGSVNPDAVDAAAIMAFRNKLPDNIKAPVPTDDWFASHKGPVTGNAGISKNPFTSTTVKDVSDVYNEGILKCSDELNSYFLEASKTYGVDAKLLKAIAYTESNFLPNVTSKSGAMGIMQLMPGTAEYCGVENAYDPKQGIMGGAKYLSMMLEEFDGNITHAVASYNAGANNVQKYNGVPPFAQNYVNTVMGYYNL